MRVPADKHRAGIFALVKPQQEVDEAEDRAGRLIAVAPDGFRQGVIGAMGKGVAVDNEKRLPHASPVEEPQEEAEDDADYE